MKASLKQLLIWSVVILALFAVFAVGQAVTGL